jgi:hypothetical protein
MATPPNFRISPAIPSGPTDLFLAIFAKFSDVLVIIIKVSPWLANFISGMLGIQQKTDA